MQDEFGAHLRSTKMDSSNSALKGVKFRDQSSIEQFNTTTEVVFIKLLEIDITFIKQDDLSTILEKIDDLDKPGYKNSVAYILGYYARNLKEKNVNEVFSELEKQAC